MIKRAMITIDHEIAARSLGTRMLLQVHDELLFEVPKQEIDEAKILVASLMKTALPLSVPIEVDVGVGKNWLEAH
jgi:DNA polymerase-1